MKYPDCSRPYCDGPGLTKGLCPACYSYRQGFGKDRPVELVLWPGVGHPLATTEQVVALTGLTYRVIDYAIHRDLVRPTVEPLGSGFSRGWAVDDVVALLESYARYKFPKTLSQINGITLKVDLWQLRKWVLSRWPPGAEEQWDGSLPEWLVA